MSGETKMGRPALNPLEVRSEIMRVRVRPAAKLAFELAAEAAGLEVADAHRLALREWTARNSRG